ncbi:MAG: colanic acid biosynthesis fucosyltransferase WcaI [Rhodothermia bacterium]|nr:MAG: colanic acid biosynthesis fucosyltransferase WcaI [Rhodothermia bacterium]
MPKTPTRLLVIVNVYRPDLGGGVLFSDLCEGLAEKDFAVTVKCAYSYYPEWANKSGDNGWRIRSTVENRVNVERHGIYIPGNPNSLLQRLLYEASFYLSLRRRRPASKSFDAILVICPLIGAVAYASAAKRKIGAPLWLNVQDLSAQAAAAGGISNSGFLTALMIRIQNRLFAKADIWSTISAPMVEVLENLGSGTKSVELIPNWLHRSLAESIEEQRDQPRRERSSEVRLLYSGNIGTKQDLLAFCRHLQSTPANFSLRIQGDGGRAPELRSWIDGAHDQRFEIHGLSDESALARALFDADYYLITERTGVGRSFIPSKLIPGISSGTPILAICDSDSPLGDEMSRFELGPQITWLNLDDTISVLTPGKVNSDEYEVWSTNALARSTYYSQEQGIARCANLIRRMVG